MTRNPEFIRNLWLVYSPRGLALRAMVVIAVYAGIYFFVSAIPDSRADISLYAHPLWIELCGIAFAFFVILMGSKPGHSIAEELSGHTWDAQRMSSISPWSMTWGKVFGISVNVWFGALVCILCFSYIARYQGYPDDLLVRHIAVWILAAFLAQTSSLIGSLLDLIAAPPAEEGESGTIGALFVTMPGIFAIALLWVNLPVDMTLNWFGNRFLAMDILILLAAGFAAWSLLGAHLLMRREFRYTHSPLAWLGFVAFVILFVVGLVTGPRLPESTVETLALGVGNMLPFIAASVLVYAAALTDPADWRLARHLGRSIAGRDWSTLAHRIPRSVPTLIVLAIVMVWILASEPQLVVLAKADWHGLAHDVVPAGFFLVARDAGIFLYLAFSFTGDPTKLLGLLTVGLLSIVLPILAGLFAAPLLPFLWPVSGDGAIVSLLSLLIQAGAIWALLAHRMLGVHRQVL